MRVLLIEDNEDHAYLVTRALQGHKVEWVNRLDDALGHPELNGFELALTDLSLPDADGIDSVTRLSEAAPSLPLVVLTSLADDRAIESALAQGALDYLYKEEILGDGQFTGSLLQRAARYALLRQAAMGENRRLMASLQENRALLERKNERLRTLCETAQRFVENVSHDFRTPLTVIKEYSSLIRDGVEGVCNDEQQQMLHVVEDRADDLNTMVDDLLDLSKLDAGLLNVWPRKTEVARIVAHISPGLERKAAVRRVTLVNAIDAGLPVIFCEEEKAGRVIVNLVTNAIKFCPEGGRVELWARANDDRNEVVIGVTDNGPGIAPSKRQEIFERFAQGHAQSRQSVKGFGLGLSIARELADLNLGRLELDSELGKGSTFTFTIPYADPDQLIARYLNRVRDLDSECAICTPVTITTSEAAADRDLNDLDVFLSHNVRGNDLALRMERCRWLMLLFVPPVELDEFIQRTREEVADINRNRPLGALPEIDFQAEEPLAPTEPPQKLRAAVSQLLTQEAVCHA